MIINTSQKKKKQISKKPDKEGKQPDELRLPKWVKVSKQRFDVIKKKVQNAKKNKKLQIRPKGSRIININK